LINENQKNNYLNNNNINLGNNNNTYNNNINNINNTYNNNINNINNTYNNNINNINNNYNNNNINNFYNNINSNNINNNNSLGFNNNMNNNYNPIIRNNNVPPLVGLNDIGAISFMNPTLQCLSQTLPLSEFFLNQSNQNIISNNNLIKNDCSLSSAYLDLINNLWNSNDGQKIYAPYLFKNTIEKLNPLFDKKEGEIKDLIIFILNRLHIELKTSSIEFQNSNTYNNNLGFNQYDKKSAFNFALNDLKNNFSIISNIFCGFIEKTYECLNCKSIYNAQNLDNPICYIYEIFNFLIFPLENVKYNKYNKYNNNNLNIYESNIYINNNIISIYDCFEYYQKKETLTGINKSICQICNEKYDSIYSSKIFLAPNVLIIILDRDEDNNNIKIDIKEKIDITNYVINKDSSNMIYELYGVISNLEQNVSSPQYIASCLNSIDNNWYRFEDAIVSEKINNIQKDVIEFGIPSILFYKKQNYNNNIFNNIY